jgi:hypothetical protein
MKRDWKYDEFSEKIIGRVAGKAIVAQLSKYDLQAFVDNDFADFADRPDEIKELKLIAEELGLQPVPAHTGLDVSNPLPEEDEDLEKLMEDMENETGEKEVEIPLDTE